MSQPDKMGGMQGMRRMMDSSQMLICFAMTNVDDIHTC